MMPPEDGCEGEGRRPEDEPVQGQVRHQSVSAIVPRDVAQGVFSNGVLILTGAHEVVLDFLFRMGEQQRVAARVILPHLVARQFVAALDHDLRMYESQYGSVPRVPRPRQLQLPPDPFAPDNTLTAGESGAQVSVHPENLPEPPRQIPTVEDIYHDLKVSDEVLAGAYANSVLIRHSGTEFCFDFITNVYPRSAVSARVFMATPHVAPLLHSLSRSMQPPGDGPRMG